VGTGIATTAIGGVVVVMAGSRPQWI